MTLASQNWILATILSIILIVALVLVGKYYAKYSHSHINDVKDLAKHPDKYRLYFLVTGVFFPTSEAMFDVFKVRNESELLHYLVVGAFCVSMAIMSQYIEKVRSNLHKIFVGFFCILSIFLFCNIYTAPSNSVNLIEFTMFVILAYYVFFNIKHFYTYILVASIFLAILLSADIIDAKLFILYFNSCFVAFVFTYAIDVIDVNIKENLFFAYNFVNKGTLLVVGIDEQAKVIFVSENIKTILGYNKEECIGKNWQNIMLNAVEIEDTEGLGKKVFLQKIILRNEKYKLIEWRDEALRNDLIIKVGKDVTESQKAEIALKRTSELLEQTNRIARVGGWEYDFEKQKIYYSEITKELFGVVEASKSSRQKILNYFVEGENRNTLVRAFEKCVKYGISYDCELQIINDKGQKLWVRTKGTSEFVNNRTKRIYGIIQDIDEQAKAKIALIDSEERFRFIAENTSDVILSFDAGKVNYLSPVHQKLFGYTTEESISIAEDYIYNFVHPDDREMVRDKTKQAIQKRIRSVTYTFRFLHKNGKYIWREDTVDMIYDENGLVMKVILLARDVSERKSADLTKQNKIEKQLLQNNILIRLSKTPFGEHDFWGEDLKTITEAAEKGIGAGRVGIYDYIDNSIICRDLFIKETNTHSSGDVLTAKDFPAYFDGIDSGLAIVAHDAHTHPNTYEFSETYLTPLGITSMLDISIRVAGELVGVVCWEHTQQQRIWTDEDVAFARSIADIISLGIEADKRRKAEIALNRAKAMLEQTSVVANIGGWEIDIDSQYLYFSEINNVILEAPDSFKLDIKTAFSFYKKGYSRDKMYEVMMLCYTEGDAFDVEVQIITLKENERWVRAMGQSEFQNGQCKRIFGTFQDITARKNAEAKLTENQVQLVYKSEMLAAIAKITEKLWVSTDIEETLNQSFAEIGKAANADRIYYFENNLKTNTIGQKVEWVREAISPQINNQATQNLSFDDIYFYTEPLLQNKIFQKTISNISDPKMKARWEKQNILSVLLIPVLIKNNFYGFIGIDDCTQEQIWSDDKLNLLQSLATNIASAIERLNNESIIKESENNFRQINETIDDVFFLYDKVNLKYIYISPSCKKVLGVTQQYFYDGNIYANEFLFEEDRHINEIIETQLLNNASAEVQYKIKTNDRQIKWINQKLFAIYNDNHQLVRISGICSDITERKLAQNEIKQLSLVAEKITNGVLITDPLGHVLWANQSLLDMMEIPAEQLLGKRPRDLFNPQNKDSSQILNMMDNLNYTLEAEVLTFKKNKKWIQINNTGIKDEEGNVVQQIEIIIDITERKKAEVELLIAHQETNTANKLKAELELRALQMQMNPHFVFNALNSIQSYVMSQDAASANNYLTKFAQLIRLFLDSSRSKFIPLEEEIRLLTLYIELEKIRFEEKFDFEIVLDKKVNRYFEIPTMILQPFVENAINHGLRYKKEKGLLSIKFFMEADYMICKIEDNGVGRKNAEKIQKKSNKGYQSQGLKITAERLMTYNKLNEANIEFSVNDLIQKSNNQNDEVGTMIEIKFPEN